MKSFEPSGSDSLASAMTKAVSNERANRGVGRAAVERHVKAQVLELHGVAALLREFAQAHDKYAQDYAIKLPLTAPPGMDLKSCPQLHRVTQQLERFLACTAQAHATLASELRTSVVAPLEAFEKQQRHQTKQLLSEIDDALQRETRVHASLQRLLSKEEPASLVIDDNQDTEVLADLVRADAKAAQDTCDRERNNVRQRLAELDLTDEQQSAILHGQLRRCFDAIARHARRVLGDAADSLASLALLTASQQRREARGYFGSDHDAALAYSTLHVDVTSWMIAVFSQLLPIEEAMVKRLQTLVKSHPLATVKAVFGDSLPTDESTETTTLWDLLVSHKQLAANLADPIARTLRVSKQKQETIRNEVSESMSELERLAQAARNRVTDKEAKLLQFLQQEQQQQDDMTRPVLGGTGTETVVSSFNLRSAVAALTRQLSSSPKKPLLFKSKSVSSVGVLVMPLTPPSSLSPAGVTVTKSPRRVTLESDLIEARVQVETLANKRVVQKDEMVQTLEASAFVGVKTLEAMVSDYLKNVTKAMALAATATAKCTERLSANEETPTKASRRFQTIRLFDIGDPSDAEVAKRLGDDLGPETTHTSETEMSETGTESGEAIGPPVKPLEVVRRSSATFVLPTEEEMKKRLSAVATEVVQICSELPIRETIEQIWSLTKTLLGVAWRVLDQFLHNVHRSPDQWQCVVAVVVLLGLLCVVRRFDRLDRGWHELTELHRENARGLQQLVNLIGG